MWPVPPSVNLTSPRRGSHANHQFGDERVKVVSGGGVAQSSLEALSLTDYQTKLEALGTDWIRYAYCRFGAAQSQIKKLRCGPKRFHQQPALTALRNSP